MNAASRFLDGAKLENSSMAAWAGDGVNHESIEVWEAQIAFVL